MTVVTHRDLLRATPAGRKWAPDDGECMQQHPTRAAVIVFSKKPGARKLRRLLRRLRQRERA